MSKLWGGRFTGKTDPIMEQFNNSFAYDKRLALADIDGSKAYSTALGRCGLLAPEEVSAIHGGLAVIRDQWVAGTFQALPSDEDIHSANERVLTDIIGPLGGKLHTGRSRNDQVATDVRIWLAVEIEKIAGVIRDLLAVFVNRAEHEIDVIMPGYTHLQPAQPIRWSHWLLAHATALERDHERLLDCLKRVRSLPLGSGAIAGHAFGIDRLALADDIGFSRERVCPNSIDAVVDRDFITEFIFAASQLMVHLSKFGEDLIIYSSLEFGFVRISDAYSTGSSLMPQKRNPDGLELIRGKTGRVIGHLNALLIMMKGLPSAYNKDMQEDKEALFDTVDTISMVLAITTGIISDLTINPAKMLKSLSYEMLATDLAEYLVRKGIPFRETHHIVGKVIQHCEHHNKTHGTSISLPDVSLDDLKKIHPAFEANVTEVWDFARSVEMKNSLGGTAKSSVLKQIERMRAFLKNFQS